MSAPATVPLGERLHAWQRRFVLVGAAGSALLFVGALVDTAQFFRSWLWAWLFWLAPGLGSLGVVMLYRVTGGAWGFAIRRLLEAGTRTLPLLAVLFIPVLLGMGHLYPWTDAEEVAGDPLLQHKQAWLNVPFFVGRAVLYFAVWILLARAIGRLTDRHDRTGDARLLRKLRAVAAPGIVLYVLTMTFAAMDWAMSTEPHWFSTIYGAYFIVGQGLATFAFAVFVARRLSTHEPFGRWMSPSHFHDLGNLMLAFTMLWAYMAFSQFLIIWSGHLPEETIWYAHRTTHGWQIPALLLVTLQFAVPFFLLLLRKTKRSAARLARLAVLILALRLVDMFWVVAPAFHPDGFHLSWLDVVAPVAIGGWWLAWFVKNLRGRPLLSLHDARLQRELEEAPHA